MSWPFRISGSAQAAETWLSVPMWAIHWDCPGSWVQNRGWCILSGALPGGLVTGRQQAQEGWWMWLLPLLSPTSHSPPSASLPAQTPGATPCPDKVGPCPDIPAGHSTWAQAATDFGFCQKGWSVTPWLGGGDRPFPQLCLFTFCTGLHTPGFKFWFQARSIKQSFSLRRIYLLITWKIQSKSEVVCKGI